MGLCIAMLLRPNISLIPFILPAKADSRIVSVQNESIQVSSVVESFVRLLLSVYKRKEQHLQIELKALASTTSVVSVLCWRDTPPWA